LAKKDGLPGIGKGKGLPGFGEECVLPGFGEESMLPSINTQDYGFPRMTMMHCHWLTQKESISEGLYKRMAKM
jgi:hypothetical protein